MEFIVIIIIMMMMMMKMIIIIIGLSGPFSSSLHSILENVLSISSRTLWNVRMLVSISSLVDHF